MTAAEFLNAVALGQVTPGPIVHTIAAVGYAACSGAIALLGKRTVCTPTGGASAGSDQVPEKSPAGCAAADAAMKTTRPAVASEVRMGGDSIGSVPAPA